MKTLGYYNGKFGPLEEMTVPMNDRACYFGAVYMKQHLQETERSSLKRTSRPPATVRAFSGREIPYTRKN